MTWETSNSRNGKEVNTMMDMSSMIDAGLALGGAMAVVLMGIALVSSDSTTVSTSSEQVTSRSNDHDGAPPLQIAA